MKPSLALPSLLATLHFLFLLPPSSPSAWDPHPWPSTPPYVEGWYVRLSGLETGDSIALIFGASLLPPAPPPSLPPVYLAILHGDVLTNKTVVYESTPPLEAVEIRQKDGQPVTEAVDWKAPPGFTWRVIDEAEDGAARQAPQGSKSTTSSFSPEASSSMNAIQRARHLFLRVSLPTAAFWAQIDIPPWTYDGPPRPHSWTDVVDAVPLHWYIHSLSSRVVYARLELKEEGGQEGGRAVEGKGGGRGKRIIESHRGQVHLEKNWGRRFPDAWLWSQGVASLPLSDPSSSPSPSTTPSTTPSTSSIRNASSIAFVFSYGQVTPGVFTHFAHFRDQELGLAWDFKPSTSVLVEESVEGCQGRARFVLEGWGAEEQEGGGEDGEAFHPSLAPRSQGRRRLSLELVKPRGSSACLLGPTGTGFERLCEESFQGEARVEAAKEGGKEGGWRVVREAVLSGVAVELGGTMRCEGRCEDEEGMEGGREGGREEGRVA